MGASDERARDTREPPLCSKLEVVLRTLHVLPGFSAFSEWVPDLGGHCLKQAIKQRSELRE